MWYNIVWNANGGFHTILLLKEKIMNYTLTTNRPRTMSDFSNYKDWVIGYDKIFQNMLNFPTASTTNQSNYPPHNLTETSEGKYTITIAVAGLAKEDIKISLEEQNLTISYENKLAGKEDPTILYQGIAHRSFNKVFHLAESIEVKDAIMSNGLIVIELEQNIPEHKKPKLIELK